jgi:hypothetical protein
MSDAWPMSEASERIFEALVDPERDPEFSYSQMAHALRTEAYERAPVLEHMFQLAGPVREAGVRGGVVQQVNRGRILGLSHLHFWQCKRFERELREFIARKTLETHR